MQVKRLTRLSPLAAAVAIGFESACALAQQTPEPNRYGYGPYMMMDGWGYGMILGPLFMILVVVVVIAAAAAVVCGVSGPLYSAHPPQPPQPGRSPLDILKERFARGEIDKNEYEERRRVLGE